MPLYTKYRWNNLDDILGNESLKIALITSIEKEETPHTFMLTGESGTGKTTTARIIANELGCHKNDLYEYDVGYAGGVDQARIMKENCIYPPMYGKTKVYILDECQSASKQFWESSLKMLEEPPKHSFFILCTTDPQKIPNTIKTRATKLKFELLSDEDMNDLILKVVDLEGFESFPEEAIEEIIKVSKGSPREALNILDLVLEVADDEEVLKIIKAYTASEENVIDLCRALVYKKPGKEVAKILKSLDKVDEEKIRRAILSYANKVLLDKWDENSATIINEFREPFFNSGKAGLSLACYVVLQ